MYCVPNIKFCRRKIYGLYDGRLFQRSHVRCLCLTVCDLHTSNQGGTGHIFLCCYRNVDYDARECIQQSLNRTWFEVATRSAVIWERVWNVLRYFDSPCDIDIRRSGLQENFVVFVFGTHPGILPFNPLQGYSSCDPHAFKFQHWHVNFFRVCWQPQL